MYFGCLKKLFAFLFVFLTLLLLQSKLVKQNIFKYFLILIFIYSLVNFDTQNMYINSAKHYFPNENSKSENLLNRWFYKMISHLYLSILFLTPGLFISGVLRTQNRFLLTSSFSVFFWSIGTLILEINYLINTFFGNLFVGLMFVYWFLRFKNYQNIVYNLIFLSVIELINNVFGILHIVSTFSITLEAALQNLDYVSSSVNVPAVQITFLKFFNNEYFLATLPHSWDFLFY